MSIPESSTTPRIKKHTSTLTIPINVNPQSDFGSDKRRESNEKILSQELNRMNFKMNELRKSFEDLTSSESSHAFKHKDEGHRSFERTKREEVQNSGLSSCYSTMPGRFETIKQQVAPTPVDNFEREVQNFRKNFDEFKRSTTANRTPTREDIPFTNNPRTMTSTMMNDSFHTPFGTMASTGMSGVATDESHRIVESSSGRKLYQVTLNMKDFKPQDIRVKIVDGKVLRVEGRLDAKTETGGNIQKEFHREFTIPPNVDTDALVSRIDARGIMNLEAPVLIQYDGIDSRHPIASPDKFSSSTSRSFSATSNSFFNNNSEDGHKIILPEEDILLPRRKYSWTSGNPYIGRPPNILSAMAPRSGVEPFKLTVDMKGYSADQIKIDVRDDSLLRIRARRDNKDSGGMISREFNREYTIPRDVNLDSITSLLSKEGILTIETVLPPSMAEPIDVIPDVFAYHRQEEPILDTPGFKLTFDMKDYVPEEIKVKVLGGSLRIEAKHMENSPEKGSIVREFSREYVIPAHVEPDQLRSSLSNMGILTIEAPSFQPK
ncbi:unnamed protein product [Gordionus sp. m RMFG-2023]|uniref:uncharacterized protein LOC135931153 n=1 Tax=Gordionus sp. m RMFG-2023 TaxID=3053472 RepID=UPI0030DE0D51